MKVEPKYPPAKPCGLKRGYRYRVVTPFRSGSVNFVADEVLTFELEMLDVYDGCDVWVFSPLGSKREKVIAGIGDFSDPSFWRSSFEEMTGE